eukprot:TRINITY_DN16810_c0_g2_i1.p1 TRINITY_DN16810_c0_g2~~TRINITY_DN16810_c0_g2_i1.p1  ORF type:complete len:727 (-),score=143.85 TRINITY_DN16810_c0_g2_i1:675-2855(-)
MAGGKAAATQPIRRPKRRRAVVLSSDDESFDEQAVSLIPRQAEQSPCTARAASKRSRFYAAVAEAAWLRGYVEDVSMYALHITAPHTGGHHPSSSSTAPSPPKAISYVAPFAEVDPAVLMAARSNPFLSPSSPGFRARGAEICVRFLADDLAPGCGESQRAACVQMLPPSQLSLEELACLRLRDDGLHDALAEPVDAAVRRQTPHDGVDSRVAEAAPAERAQPSNAGRAPLADVTAALHDNSRLIHCRIAEALREPPYAFSPGLISKLWSKIEDRCQMEEALDSLEATLQRNTLKQCPSDRGICDVLLLAAGGLAPPGVSFFGSTTDSQQAAEVEGPAMPGQEEEARRSPDEEQQQRQKIVTGRLDAQEARLRDIVIAALDALPLERDYMRLRVLPALEHLQNLLGAANGLPEKNRLQWRRLAALVEAALQQCDSETNSAEREAKAGFQKTVLYAHPVPSCQAVTCNVEGCEDKIYRYKRHADMFGDIGPRCYKHIMPCDVPNCKTPGTGTVSNADDWGPPGWRCYRHGAQRCEVPGCMRQECEQVLRADAYGQPGRRCWLHSTSGKGMCSVDGCFAPACGSKLKAADEFGPRGYRCSRHGGAACSVAGCRREAWGAVKERDWWGDPGKRCYKHGGVRCSVEGCEALPRCQVRVADSFGSPGPRCERHLLRPRSRRRYKKGVALRNSEAAWGDSAANAWEEHAGGKAGKKAQPMICSAAACFARTQ